MGFKRNYTNRSCDQHFCFFIQDFQEGDSVIVVVDGKRVKGRVASVGKRDNSVFWADANDGIRKASLDDFAYLGPYDKDWL